MDDRPKSEFWKFFGGLVLIVFGTVAAYVAVKLWQAKNQAAQVKILIERMEKERAENYELPSGNGYGEVPE